MLADILDRKQELTALPNAAENECGILNAELKEGQTSPPKLVNVRHGNSCPSGVRHSAHSVKSSSSISRFSIGVSGVSLSGQAIVTMFADMRLSCVGSSSSTLRSLSWKPSGASFGAMREAKCTRLSHVCLQGVGSMSFIV